MQAARILRRAGCVRASRHATTQHSRRQASSEQQQSTNERERSLNGTQKPSVADRLFPNKRLNHNRNQAARTREIPRIPLHSTPFRRQVARDTALNHAITGDTDQGEYPMLDESYGPSPVLKLEAVSKNLTITDFRRIIPQGKHIEGWTLQNGDIVKVVPGLQLDTLAPRTFYFLVFASAASAQAYLEHARTVHELAKQYTPESLHAGSHILPPGITAMGMDVASVVQAYSLISPDSRMFLRQLNYPLSPWTMLFLRDGGLPWVMQRPGRSPYELRLTLDGPEVTVDTLRKAFRASSDDRALPWSGGSDYSLNITRLDPTAYQDSWSYPIDPSPELDDADRQIKHRGEAVYILGFDTAHAARSFRAYWHKRELVQHDSSLDDEDPPVLNLDLLW